MHMSSPAEGSPAPPNNNKTKSGGGEEWEVQGNTGGETMLHDAL